MLFFPWSNKKSVNLVVSRFLQVFRDHGMMETQIPNFLPQVSLSAISSSPELLKALTPDVLEQAAKLFGIRRQWLEGVGEQIYDGQYCHQEPEYFFEYIAALNLHNFAFRILTTHRHLDRHNSQDQRLVLVVVERITNFGEQEINRYHLFLDNWRWNYAPTRIEIKSLARIIHRQLLKPIPIFQVSHHDMDKLEAGRLIPHNLVNGCMYPDPSLEDYALSQQESCIAKEIDELPRVQEYIKEHQLGKLVRELFTRPAKQGQLCEIPKPAPAAPVPGKEPGKRARTDEAIWKPIRTIAQTWWAKEGDALGIAEAVRRVKELPHLQAAHLSDSAIRKQIDKLAPPRVRKPGRRPNKSPEI
jgi:hypothetical protein